jgi:hypothetical protein
MTLLELKKQTMALIEELKGTIAVPAAGAQSVVTDDPDILAKLNYVINNIQYELAQIKRIGAKTTFTYVDTYEFDLPVDFYQVDKINCDYYIYGSKIVLDTEEATMDMYYYKYPTVIDNDTDDEFELELTQDCLNAMPYGVASDILKSDVSVDYTVYANRYNELKNGLRLSNSSPMVYVDTTNAINDTETSEF